VWNVEDDRPYLACSSVFGVYSTCNIGMHHAMVVTQMWQYNNKFFTWLFLQGSVNTVAKNMNNLLSRIHSYSLSVLHNNVVVYEDHITSVADEWMSMEHRWNELHGKTEVLKEKLIPIPLCPPQFLHGLVWNIFCASTVRVQ
jgi:hypothetical protein